MKHIIRFLLFPIMLFCQNNNSYTFSEPIIVNSNPDLGLSRPQIITQNNGDPLIMWTSIDDKKIYVSRYLNGEFNEPILISPPDLTFYGNQNYGPEIDSNDDYIAIVLHNSIDNLNNVYLIYSTDNGQNFSNPIKIIEEEAMIEGAGIKIDPNNRIILTYETLTNDGEVKQMVGFGEFTFEDPGINFTDFTIANLNTEGVPCECCLGDVASNGADVIFTYRNNIDNIRNMYACTYNNDKQIFNSGFSIDNYNQPLSVCPTEGPRSLILNNYLFTTFKSYAYSPARISVSMYDFINESLQAQSTVDWGEGFGVQSLPKIANNNSHIAVVWKEFRYYNIDVFISILNSSEPSGLNLEFTQSNSISSSEPNSQQAEDFINVDICGYNNYFHITYLDYNNRVIYYRTYFQENINNSYEYNSIKTKVRTIDLIGREGQNKGFNIDIYNDGSVEKKYIFDK